MSHFKLIFLALLSSLVLLCEPVQAEDKEADGQNISDFFKASKYKLFSINPSGTAVAFIEPKEATYDLIIYDLKRGTMDDPITFERQQLQVQHKNKIMSWETHYNKIYELKWLSDSFLSLKQHSNGRFHRYVLVEFADRSQQPNPAFRLSYISQNGYWVDTLPNQTNKAIFARYEHSDDYDYYIDLFKLDLTEKISESNFRRKLRLNKTGPKLHNWVFDSKGWRLAGTRTVDDVTELFARTGSKPKKYRYKSVWESKKGDVLKVVGGNAEKLLLLTNNNSDKINLRTFDIESQQFAEVVFEHPFYDLTAAIRHPETKDIIGVSFIEKGMAKQVYFSDDYNVLTTRLSKSTKIEGVYAVDMDKSGNNIIFVADDSANPGQTYYYNRTTDSFSHLIDLYPWLSNKSLSKTKLLRLEAEDGVTLEAFLTLPSTQNPPLVVIPHGGPIGVSDSRHYSGNIQVLVDAGFATLQVNYRGSAGYGKAFKQQGLQQWGRLIEDDIEQALSFTKDNYEVNANQVCIVGGSYGGYSALYSVIRSPQLYKCAASFAGVTDLALRFQRSDAQRDGMMRALTEIMGDPKTQQDELFKYSPLYQFKGITKPVFIAHGTDDNNVDIEHSYRLHFALKDHGIKHKWMVMDDVGHGFSDPDDAAVYYNALIEFLSTHLEEEQPVLNH
ncbi:alpha/beta hydrolase family protein [Alteromonas stellipolaris]|uniref:alpha/beta hydrolase family protein n=1 Tax=Alteromonas stellipolaris TaxID=233316 RepID=UPI001D94F9B7|nr:prolyl oligopeptidase family serine peptidase [Alteromonas stellipolaris]MBZ2163474.1 prolyl oligopeptidase family serine peptidase [Alteromonas stellipolaris]